MTASTRRVRPAAHDEWRRLGAILADAFDDDPVWMWICPDPVRRRRHLGQLFAQVIRPHVRRDTAWTTDALEGGAVWAAPGEWKAGPSDVARSLVPALRAVGLRHARARLGALPAMERGHPTEPHWYLEILAARSDLRGRGVGSALIAPMIERCDADGLPAYLESSKYENLAFYHRFGFEVTEEVVIAHGCPPMWRMWRPAPG
ncbi:MAG: GNAT family N-acetyltransferase [Microthrixaceae bacterium]